jgi:thiol-disulfide isomerase/thioredoxin
MIIALISWGIYYCKNFTSETTEKFENMKKISGSKGTVFVLVYADWCPHCTSVKPIWMKLTKELNTKNRKIFELNENQTEIFKEFTGKYPISGYPTIFYIKNGVAEEYKGDREEKEIKKFILSKKMA